MKISNSDGPATWSINVVMSSKKEEQKMKPRKPNTSSSIRQCCRGTCNENENPVSKEPKQVPAAETCNKFYHSVFSRVDYNFIFNALIVDQTIKSVRLPNLSIKNIAIVVDRICKRKCLIFERWKHSPILHQQWRFSWKEPLRWPMLHIQL
jgi:hypothetical protein